MASSGCMGSGSWWPRQRRSAVWLTSCASALTHCHTAGSAGSCCIRCESNLRSLTPGAPARRSDRQRSIPRGPDLHHLSGLHAVRPAMAQEKYKLLQMSCLLKGLHGVQVASRVEALHAADLWHGRLNAETVLLQGASSVQLLGTCSTGAQVPARDDDAVEHDPCLLSTDRPSFLEELTAMWCVSKVSLHLAASVVQVQGCQDCPPIDCTTRRRIE